LFREEALVDQEILYLQQVERLTTAAAEIEAKTFNPWKKFNDLNQQSDKFDSWFGSSSAWLKKLFSRTVSNNR